MKFTARGLIYKTKNSYCRNWEELYKVEKRDTQDKIKKFRSKYKDLIKEIEVDTKRGKETLLIALKELSKNKVESSYQKIARGLKTEITTNNDIKQVGKFNKIISKVLGVLSEMVLYQWDSKYLLVDFCLVDSETGEVRIGKGYIFGSIKEFIKMGAEPLEISWSLLVDFKYKIDGILLKTYTRIDEDGEVETYNFPVKVGT
ncbi:hypothetical protein [Cetobacterium sp.]|uniref:hypothetical protein n=1 Tax=Cetobacterium sp. TaxID=2071632 RepID=UPI003F2BBF37